MRLDTLVVGSLLGLEALGIYSIAAAAAEVFLLFPRSLVNATLTRSAAPGKPFDIVQVLQLLGAFLAVPMLLAAVVVPIALELLFGPRFHGVGFLSIVMLPGVYLFGLGTTSIYYLFGQGRSGAALLASFIGAVAKVAFSLALIPPLGTFGAALASSLAYALFAAVGLGALARHQETSIGKILTPDFGLASRLAIRLMRRWRVLDDTPSSGGSL